MTDLSTSPPKLLCAGLEASRLPISEALAHYKLDFVPDAFGALRAVNAQPFDGYLLDCWLPDLSGSALCREIRKVDPHAPIVFCSGSTRGADRERALRAGANAYVCTPFDPEQLCAQLKAFLNLSLARSLSAKLEEERAIQDELQRQLSYFRTRSEAAEPLKDSFAERMTRARAHKAFVDAGGTRAHFESWWPRTFSSARARFQECHSSEDTQQPRLTYPASNATLTSGR